MRKTIAVIAVAAVMISLVAGLSYAGGSKTWSNVGKGLAIYEGVKVLTGRQGNIVDDVTGVIKPKESSSSGTSSDESYNAGYRKGYEEGYNAGFRNGAEKTSK